MKKGLLLLLAFANLFICVSFAGCADESTQTSNKENDIIQNSNTQVIEIIEMCANELLEPDRENATARTVAYGANNFAFRLSAALATHIGTSNFVCSPFSVWLPLAALVNATDNQKKADMLSALYAVGISEADLNTAASRMLYDLTNQNGQRFATEQNMVPHDPLRIANAIFVGKNVTLRRDFAQTFLDYYRGQAINVDFNSIEAVDAVNDWASENTEGLITEVINALDPETVAAIANAIYFSDRWEWEFDPDETTEDKFHSPVGDTTAFFMLREGDNQVYYEDDVVQAMRLRFKTGGSLNILLPKDGNATALLTSMTSKYFEEIQRDSILATVRLLLPRFSVESGVMQLADTLDLLGVPLFDKEAAPLTGGLIEEELPVWLSGALHCALIEVDEKGTTAAAVTALYTPGASIPEPTETFEMVCNRPFVFVLCSNTYDGGNQVLFTGIVNTQ